MRMTLSMSTRTLWLFVTMEKTLALQITGNFFSFRTHNQLLAYIFDKYLLNHCEQQPLY